MNTEYKKCIQGLHRGPLVIETRLCSRYKRDVNRTDQVRCNASGVRRHSTFRVLSPSSLYEL